MFFIGRSLVTTCRTGCIVTVTSMGRTSPEINILREILTNIGGPTTFPFNVTSSALPLFGPATWANNQQNEDVENTEEQTKCNCQS